MQIIWAGVCAAALLLASAPAEGAPRRVASLNLCTDELLLALAAPGQIVSVSHLSRKAEETLYWRAARAYPANDGSLLSVVARKPDLVLTMGGSGRDTARIAARIGARVLTLPYAASLAEMKAGVRTVAAALGRGEAGERLLRPLEAMERSVPAAAIDTIWLGGGGRSLAASGTGAEWMRLAGLRQRPLPGDRVTLEQLLTAPPRLVLRSDYRSHQYSGEQRWLSHPLAARVKARTIHTDGRRWTCMGPALIPEIARLRKAVLQ